MGKTSADCFNRSKVKSSGGGFPALTQRRATLDRARNSGTPRLSDDDEHIVVRALLYEVTGDGRPVQNDRPETQGLDFAQLLDQLFRFHVPQIRSETDAYQLLPAPPPPESPPPKPPKPPPENPPP